MKRSRGPARDVSQRRRAERAQRVAENTAQAIFEVAAEPMALSVNGRFARVNPAFARLFGFDRPEEAVGLSVSDLVPPAERERLVERHRLRLSGGPVPESYSIRCLRRDGTELEVEVKTAGRAEDGGIATVSILRDVTDRVRAEAERAALQERLRQAEKLEAIGRLAGGVAHDFNNILSGILGYAELTSLELEPGSEPYEHQQRIREAALRARDLVRQILTFSQRERSSQRPVDVPMLVKEALALMRAGIPSSAMVEVSIDEEAGATLADPTQLHQIVLNLCSNARDAIGPYGRIEISVAAVDLEREGGGVAAGSWIRFRVRDDGVGIDESTRARLFEPFVTTKGPFGGHGLGLAVVHGIVTGIGGVIQVDSAPGRGSTFDVYLPRRERAPIDAPPPARGVPGQGERILVVDDDPMVLDAQRRTIQSFGYAVEVASNGEIALARFREAPDAFDLVLTDQTMPRLSGVDLAQALLAIRPDARVILCTGYSDRIDEEGVRALGLRALLAKPVERETLASAIRRALGAS